MLARMEMTLGSTRTPAVAIGLAAMGSALFVEHRSREAERRHQAPHHHIYIEGTRLHYRLEGEGPPVLLVHGNVVHGADFDASGLVERLAREYQVLVIDRPGFGHSDRPRGRVWTPAVQARLLRQAAAALGVERPVVVGHSLGAQVALAMALQDPLRTAGLVLVSGYYWPGLRLDRWMAAPLAVPVLGDLLRYTTAAWTARATLDLQVRAMFAPAPVPADFFKLLPRELLLRPLQQRAAAEDASHLVKQARMLQKRYASLRLPTTVVAGAHDRIVSPEQSLRLHACLPQARLRMLEGVGHMTHYQAQEQIAAGIKQAFAAGAAVGASAGDVASAARPPVAVPAPAG